MNIYTYLKKDHRKVSDLMEALLACSNLRERQEIFTTIKEELTLHSDTEEVTFYAAIEKATRSKAVEEKMEHADEEHNEIRTYLQTLSELPIESEEWMEQFGEFKHAVTHHVEEEEGEIFEKAKKYLSDEQAIQLAKEMDKLKKNHPDFMHRSAA
jgi:hemerythrin superfamily protein